MNAAAAVSAPPELTCEGVDVTLDGRAGGTVILSGVNLTVRSGEFVCVVGGSGTGKTTLLRALAGLAPVSAGAISFEGQPMTGPTPGVITVFQDYGHALLEWRTVEQNVALGIEATTDRAQRRERVAEALAVVGLTAVRSEYPWRLSGGMQQRVQIARALVMNPRVLLMDEPFGALDAMTRAALQDQLLGIVEQSGATVVFITHDIDEAVYLADRVVLVAGKPGAIPGEVEVDLARPRDQLTTRESDRYLELRREVHDLLTASHE